MKSNLQTMIVTGLVILNTFAIAQSNPKTAQPGQTTIIKADASANMKSFIGMFDGNSETVTKALAKFGKADLDTKSMEMYGLINAKITTQEITGTVEKYNIEVKSGATTRKYAVNWENGKISEITDNGVKKPSFDDL